MEMEEFRLLSSRFLLKLEKFIDYTISLVMQVVHWNAPVHLVWFDRTLTINRAPNSSYFSSIPYEYIHVYTYAYLLSIDGLSQLEDA